MIRRSTKVPEGRGDRVEIMNPDSNLRPPPANHPVKRLLNSHQTQDRLIIQGDIPDHGRTEVRPDGGKVGIHSEFDPGRGD